MAKCNGSNIGNDEFLTHDEVSFRSKKCPVCEMAKSWRKEQSINYRMGQDIVKILHREGML
jgi:glutaredoxin